MTHCILQRLNFNFYYRINMVSAHRIIQMTMSLSLFFYFHYICSIRLSVKSSISPLCTTSFFFIPSHTPIVFYPVLFFILPNTLLCDISTHDIICSSKICRGCLLCPHFLHSILLHSILPYLIPSCSKMLFYVVRILKYSLHTILHS